MNKGIYAIICKSNGKMYIGSSMDFKERKSTHFSKLRQGKYNQGNSQLQADYDLYGRQSFKFVIIEEIETNSYDLLLQKETDYIIRFGSFFEDKGYNVSIPTEKIYRKSFIEKYGEEFLRELCYSNDELLLKEDWIYQEIENRKKIYQINYNNEIVRVWDNKLEIAEFFKVSLHSLRDIFYMYVKQKNKTRKTYKGFVWVSSDKYDQSMDYSIAYVKTTKPKKEKQHKIYKTPEQRNVKRVSISLQNIENQEVRNFKSILEAEKELGFKLRPLLNGYKNKGGGKIVKVTQWRGWKIYR